jgi:Calcineurin-like phosphoesterase
MKTGSPGARAFQASVAFAVGLSAIAIAQQPAAPQPSSPAWAAVKPIDPPATPLASEAASASATRFSFLAYGDTRSDGNPNLPGDGDVVHPEHTLVMDGMLAKVRQLATTLFPVRFVLQSGDAVLRGQNAAMWNVSFTPIIERLTRGANIPYFFSVGNHDVTSMPGGDPGRALGLHNTLTAISKLIPPEGSPRRLNGYPTYAFGYGNSFFIAFDSNIAGDPIQLAWVTDQLEHLDRARYHHVIAFFHHPPFSSGPHGHDHLFDHWVERYADQGVTHRLDVVVTGGGGAPIYSYVGEPDLRAYELANVAQNVHVEHLMKPGTPADNPHHFVVVQVDGDALSLEVVASNGAALAPYGGRSRIDLKAR